MDAQGCNNLSCPLPAVTENSRSTGLSLPCAFPPVANTSATESSPEEGMELDGWVLQGNAVWPVGTTERIIPVPDLHRKGVLRVQPAAPQLSTGFYGLCHEAERNPAQHWVRSRQNPFLRSLGSWEGRNKVFSWCSPVSWLWPQGGCRWCSVNLCCARGLLGMVSVWTDCQRAGDLRKPRGGWCPRLLVPAFLPTSRIWSQTATWLHCAK